MIPSKNNTPTCIYVLICCCCYCLAGDIVERGANGELEGLDGEEGEEGGAGWDIEADDLDLPPDLV